MSVEDFVPLAEAKEAYRASLLRLERLDSTSREVGKTADCHDRAMGFITSELMPPSRSVHHPRSRERESDSHVTPTRGSASAAARVATADRAAERAAVTERAAAEAECERWDCVLRAHPEYRAELEQDARDWEAAQRLANAEVRP